MAHIHKTSLILINYQMEVQSYQSNYGLLCSTSISFMNSFILSLTVVSWQPQKRGKHA